MSLFLDIKGKSINFQFNLKLVIWQNYYLHTLNQFNFQLLRFNLNQRKLPLNQTMNRSSNLMKNQAFE